MPLEKVSIAPHDKLYMCTKRQLPVRVLLNLPGRGNKSASIVTDAEVEIDPGQRVSYLCHQKF